MDDRGWQLVAWAAVVALVLGVRLLSGGGAPPAVPIATDSVAARSAGAGRAARPALYVHVAGAVRRPGLYRVRDGARVAVAVHRAGGPLRTADMSAVNLAAPLEDGQQVVVPAGVGAGGPAAVADQPISLGGATVEQLDDVDGIGPTLAQRIVEHRQASGGLRSVDDLADVEGIGEKRLEVLRDALTP